MTSLFKRTLPTLLSKTYVDAPLTRDTQMVTLWCNLEYTAAHVVYTYFRQSGNVATSNRLSTLARNSICNTHGTVVAFLPARLHNLHSDQICYYKLVFRSESLQILVLLSIVQRFLYCHLSNTNTRLRTIIILSGSITNNYNTLCTRIE